MQAALRAAQACFTKQHRTIREYAEWLFKTFPPDMCAYGVLQGGVSYVKPDFDALRTIEETQEAWGRASKHAQDAVNEFQFGLPVGQPSGLVAFSEPDKVLRTRRTLDLSIFGREPKEVFLSIDPDREDGAHICFTSLPDSQGPSVTNIVEYLATVLFVEACEAQTRTSPPPSNRGLRSWFTQSKDNPLPLDPTRFHFYQHEPVVSRFPEAFERVYFTFDGRSYDSPQWERFSHVPAVIKDALSIAARNDKRPDAQ